MMLAAASVNAETFTTADGVLSIDAPSDEWVQTADPNYWFTMSDGKSVITVDHLSNGESLPKVQVADASYPAVFQGFVSTTNEVFVVKALAGSAQDLETLMKAIGTVKVLQYDTKTAIKNEEAAQTAEFGFREINGTYYVNTEELNVRSEYSTDSSLLGTLYYGEQVTVKGAVVRNGEDFGWYRISFNGGDAYVAAGFLSDTVPQKEEKTAEEEKVQCEFCGEWFNAGNDYRNHVMAAHPGAYTETEKVQCEFCGEWFNAGNDYRNHVMAAHPGAYTETEKVQCEYCGEWFNAGNDYRNHVMAAHSDTQAADAQAGVNERDVEWIHCSYCDRWFAAGNDYRNHMMAAHPDVVAEVEAAESQMVQCEYCGEWFNSGNDYRNHVMAAHPEASAEQVQCEFCGEWFNAGNDYRNHVMAAHGNQIG